MKNFQSILWKKDFQEVVLTLLFFKKKHKHDMLVAQIYVDDIIFGAINQDLCEHFSKEMQNEFEISMMGELTFFLDL